MKLKNATKLIGAIISVPVLSVILGVGFVHLDNLVNKMWGENFLHTLSMSALSIGTCFLLAYLLCMQINELKK